MSTTTAHYGWTKPTISGDNDTWGTELNNDLDGIDAQVYANQQALLGVVPIGAIVDFAGSSAPANWLLCDGSVYPIAGTYNKLYLAIGNTYPGGDGVSTFAVPNTSGRVTVDAHATYSLGATGGAATHVIGYAEMPAHNHPITDPGHNHTLHDPTHSHTQNPHGHAITDPGHSHTVANVVLFPGSGMASGGTSFGEGGGATGSSTTGVSVQSTTPPSVNLSVTGVYQDPAATGISIQIAGGGAAMSLMQPYIAFNKIIRFA